MDFRCRLIVLGGRGVIPERLADCQDEGKSDADGGCVVTNELATTLPQAPPEKEKRGRETLDYATRHKYWMANDLARAMRMDQRFKFWLLGIYPMPGLATETRVETGHHAGETRRF